MASSAAPCIALHDVRYSYPTGALAIDSVSLVIEPAERVVLLGANGSGKSTLLKTMAGLVYPDAGRITAFGSEVTEQTLRDTAFSNSFRRRLGFVFQSSDAQLFSPTVREEIAFGPQQLGLDAAQVAHHVADVAALLGIDALLDRAPYRLSGGEKKKVAIGAVLAVAPQVILLDEPTGGLDPRTRYWLVELLGKLGRAGKTIITATHDLDIVADIADRVVVMGENHRIAAIGTPEEILSDTGLLVGVNLVHEHWHSHGARAHAHPHHHHDADHAHDHSEEETQRSAATSEI